MTSGRTETDRRIAEREGSDASAIARVPASPHRAKIVDYSETGCRVRLSDGIAVPQGATIHLDFGPGRKVSGQVIWSSAGTAGVRFTRALDPKLANLLGGKPTALEIEPEPEEYQPDPARSVLHHWFRKLFGKAA